MSWQYFSELKIKSNESARIRPRYSLTSDILSFRRCPRQYGFYMVRGYVPARAVQLFYGTIIHEVLDRAHHHFKGLQDPSTKGKIPVDEDIEKYFNEVESSLRARGIKAINRDLKDKALRLLKRFNAKEGPVLYPRVVDTEHRLQGDRTTHIVEGVIDVLIGPDGSDSPDQVEIWDYKGAKKPILAKNKNDLKSYEYQMQVYAALYKIRNNVLPKRAILYFINELEEGESGDPIHIVDLSEDKINKALDEFDRTAQQIGEYKIKDIWNPPEPTKLPEIADTCAICDLRWSCLSYIHENKREATPSISVLKDIGKVKKGKS